MKSKDEVISEIREARMLISQECGHDIARYAEYLRNWEKEHAELIRPYKKKPARQKRMAAIAS
ncbi:MAG: hypothetical protein NTX50_11570 [Candidatus Sumerlaeota bacterium]|nr:hypothetical protein [Candidatus Sumerlaeota bacterium]